LKGEAVSCNCQKSSDERARQEELFKYLDVIDLRVVGEEATEVPETAASAIRNLNKAERAERLRLGADVANLYRRAAERDRNQAVRQLRAMLRGIDERVRRDDWAELVDRAKKEFDSGEGPALTDEAKDRFRLEVLEMDTASADDAERIVGLWDESLDRIRADGLRGGVALFRDRIERWIEALNSPEMGRQSASPISEGALACIAAWTVLGGVIIAACCYWWACCCGYAVLIWVAGNVAICLAAFP
jgi:hypothetical protein